MKMQTNSHYSKFYLQPKDLSKLFVISHSSKTELRSNVFLTPFGLRSPFKIGLYKRNAKGKTSSAKKETN